MFPSRENDRCHEESRQSNSEVVREVGLVETMIGLFFSLYYIKCIRKDLRSFASF
jgi:hypothetical protein